MKRALLYSFVILGLAAMSLGARAVELRPAEPGAIVIPNQATLTEAFAARELQTYLEAMLQVQPNIVTESEAPGTGVRLMVGSTSAGRDARNLITAKVPDVYSDSFVSFRRGNDLVLVGGKDRGTLFAVYDFLEGAGCRWFEPGADRELIPQRDAIALPEEDTVFEPVFAVREIGRDSDKTPEGTLELIDWSARNRLNRNFSLRYPIYKKLLGPDAEDAYAVRGGQVLWQHICHNTPWMFPNETYYESKPHIYVLYKGKRLPIGMEKGYVCTTHPETIEIAAEFARNWFDANPDGSVLPISVPDGAVIWCEHDACMALGGRNFVEGPEGYMTRRQVTFVNEIAKKVARTHPDRYLLNLAYSSYVWPYDGMHVEPNVIVQVCHGYAGNGNLVKPITHPSNDEARDIFKQWADAGGSGIGVWDYFVLQVEERSGSPLTPLGFANVATDMIKFLAKFEKPYLFYFTQAGRDLHEYNPFLYYVIARMAWDPTQRLEDLRNDYAEKIFGSAADPIEAYLRDLDEAYLVSDWDPGFWRNIAVPSPKVFTAEVLVKLQGYLQKARSALDPSNAYGANVLTRMQKSMDYVEATVSPKMLIESEDGIWRIERGEESYVFNAGGQGDNAAKVEDLRARAEEKGLLDDAMQRVLFRSLAREETFEWLENDRIKVGVLPGVGGRIMRLIDKKHGKNLLFEPMNITELADPGVGYFRYGAYEEYTRKSFGSPGWEFPMTFTRQDSSGLREIVLNGITSDGIGVTRLISIVEQDDSRIRIKTRLTNRSSGPLAAKIRVHPEFSVSAKLAGTDLFYKDEAGIWIRSPLAEYTATPDDVRGVWGVLDREGLYGLINEFNPDEARVHLHQDRTTQSFNLELFGPEKELQPGEFIEFQHQYRLLAGPEEWGHLFPVAHSVSEQPVPGVLASVVRGSIEVPDQSENLIFEPGRVKKGARIVETRTLTFDGVSQAIDQAGTFAAWVKLDKAAAAVPNEVIFSVGQKTPDYMVLSVNEGMLTFYRILRDPDAPGGNKSWTKVQADVSDWKAGEWVHIALVWSLDDVKPDVVELYLNGKLIDGRYNCDMIPFGGEPSVGFAYHTDSFKAPRLKGVIDEILVFNQALDGRGITGLYHTGKMGRPFSRHPALVMYVPFDGHGALTINTALPPAVEQARRHKRLLSK